MNGVHMEIYVVFRGKPPAEWAEVPGVKAVSADSLASIEGKFVLVVGDRELAERLKVGYLTEEEARELLDYIKKKKLREEAVKKALPGQLRGSVQAGGGGL
jgi:hypothetical protein